MNTSSDERVDVLVIGAGPAGSTAAALLARAGRRVRVIEKETFPRFHIGESLLPCDLPIFDRLGLTLDESKFLRKLGADFVDEVHDRFARYMFAEGLPGTPGYAYQVERSAFDNALLQLARDGGADVRENERVAEVTVHDDHVEVQTDRGVHRARYVADATGQDAFLARRKRTVQPIRGIGMGAVFCHFRGLRAAAMEELAETGNIKVFIREDGWGWGIPLIGNALSIGLVRGTQGIAEADLDAHIASSPLIQRLTEGAERTPPRIIRNFSYFNEAPYGARFGCIGDASCFLDPVFSSGVSLAMLSAERFADLVHGALEEGTEANPDLLQPLRSHMARAYNSFAALIYAFYNTRIVEHLFFATAPDPVIRAGLISVLAGDVWRSDNRFQEQLLASTRRLPIRFGETKASES